MSYCRWSDDNWRSDIYAYEAVGGGYSIHVRTHRRVGDIPELPPLPPFDAIDEELEAGAQAWIDAYLAQVQAIGACATVEIGLAYDGKSFSEDTLEDFDARLRELREMGYHVPEWVFDDIADDMQQEAQL